MLFGMDSSAGDVFPLEFMYFIVQKTMVFIYVPTVMADIIALIFKDFVLYAGRKTPNYRLFFSPPLRAFFTEAMISKIPSP